MEEIKQCLNKRESQAIANQESHFEKLSKEKQKCLIDWCILNFKPVKTFNTQITSFDIKETFCQSKDGFYATNGQIKGAMVRAGFQTKMTKDGINCRFNISKTSPYFKD